MANEESTQTISIPDNSRDMSLMQQANVLIQSGMLPVHLKRPEQVVAIMLRGKELGIGPMEALTSINVISGKVTSSTQLMLALIYRSGALEDIEMIRADPAKVTMKRRGMTAHTVAFGSQDAAKMGLSGKDTYKKFPEVMYLWRAIAMCARVVFPDIIGAVYTPDELGMEINSDVMSEVDPFENWETLEQARVMLTEEPDLPLPQLAERLSVSVAEARALRAKVKPANGEY